MPGANIPILDWLRQMKSTLEELVEGVAITRNQLRVAFASEALIRLEHCDRAGMPSLIPDSLFPAEGLPFITKRNESKFAAMAAVTWFQSPIYVLQYARNRRSHGFMWLWQRKPRFAPHFSSKARLMVSVYLGPAYFLGRFNFSGKLGHSTDLIA